MELQAPRGYKVVFVPFANGRPAGPPVDFLTGFNADGKPSAARSASRSTGRELLVADDVAT